MPEGRKNDRTGMDRKAIMLRWLFAGPVVVFPAVLFGSSFSGPGICVATANIQRRQSNAELFKDL